ncbi:hypothetical protein SBRY_10497 [Actinacidiphila bryophytorum]|uniref:Uncharacterized protein n=1 Tax=Actinacidiphila bryophytorum TaxID=1436133 RepID=A0A9W4E0I8_9ACTN|nr:hypothetical protein SBRY_10497 [Actinacidiphila bryophytorum]
MWPTAWASPRGVSRRSSGARFPVRKCWPGLPRHWAAACTRRSTSTTETSPPSREAGVTQFPWFIGTSIGRVKSGYRIPGTRKLLISTKERFLRDPRPAG